MEPTTLRAGVFGAGALGRHHVRILGELPGVELVGFHDPSAEVRERIAAEHGATWVLDPEELADVIDVAVVAAPTVHHFEIAEDLLRRDVHVMVEKPIASSLAEADRMIALAEERGLVLGVGHVEFYNPAVQQLLERAAAPRYVEVRRLGQFSPRSLDIDVILDLMIHDLQVLHALDPSPVTEVRATGIEVLTDKVDMTNVRIELESGCVANLSASRVAPEKVRELRVFLPNGYYAVDYQEQSLRGARLVPSDGQFEIERADVDVERREPLKAELEQFLARCRGDEVRSCRATTAVGPSRPHSTS